VSFPLQIKVEGLEQVRDALARAPSTLKTVVQKVAEEEAPKIVERAKQIVPVRTGALRNSIYYRITGFLGFEVGASMHYAGFVEYGTRYMRARPYLRPALEEKLPDVVDKIGETLEQLFFE